MADKHPLVLASGDVRELGPDNLLVSHAGLATVRVDSSNDDAALFLDKGASGKVAAVNAYNGGVIRWQIALGNNTAESGSAVGSDFTIARFNNSGTFLATTFTIDRATGNANFGSSLAVSGVITSGLSGTFAGTTIAGDGNGLTTSTYAFNGTTYFSNVLHTAPASFTNILSSRHTPSVSAAWVAVVGASEFTFRNDGTGLATTWTSTSDERLKENFAPLTDVLEKMKRTAIWSFTWKDGHIGMAGPQIPKLQIGVKASEFQKEWPEVIDSAPDAVLGRKLSANYGSIGAISYAGVIALIERIEALEARLAQLEAQCTGQSPTEA